MMETLVVKGLLQRIKTYETLCAIWYHLYNLKNVKNNRRGVFLSVNLQAQACIFTKSNVPPWVFSHVLSCNNGNKLRKASHI